MELILTIAVALLGFFTSVAIKSFFVLQNRLSNLEKETDKQLKDFNVDISADIINLRKDMRLLDERTSPKTLTEEQKEFKKGVEERWKTVVDQLSADFNKKVEEEYKKACEQIAFHTVKYKQSITKKRREHSRKNKATQPEKQYRSIDDE